MVDNDTVVWDAITTANFGGFDAWLDESPDAHLEIETNHGTIAEKLSDLNMNESIMEAGGLGRCLRVFRLPDKNLPRQYETEIEMAPQAYGRQSDLGLHHPGRQIPSLEQPDLPFQRRVGGLQGDESLSST